MEYAVLCAAKQLSSDYTIYVPFIDGVPNYDLIVNKGNSIYRLAINPKNNEWDYRIIFSKEKDSVLFIHRSIWKGRLEIKFELPANDGQYYWWEDFLTLVENPSKRHFVAETRCIMPTIICKDDKILTIDPIQYTNTNNTNNMIRYGTTCDSKSSTDIATMNRTLRSAFDWPNSDTLQDDLMNSPMCDIATKYGVSDRTISNWAKSYDLKTPPKGFWISRTKKYKNKGENNGEEDNKD